MPNVRCHICSTWFYVKPNRIRRGWGKYCSIKCKRNGQETGRFVKCFICDREIYRTKRDLRISKSKKYFCTKSCQTIWRNTVVFIGPRHANWRGGNSTDSYRNVLKRSGKREICTLCKTKDKRILAAHHIDRNRRNNRSENLAWLCHNCHYLVHHYEEPREFFMETLV